MRLCVADSEAHKLVVCSRVPVLAGTEFVDGFESGDVEEIVHNGESYSRLRVGRPSQTGSLEHAAREDGARSAGSPRGVPERAARVHHTKAAPAARARARQVGERTTHPGGGVKSGALKRRLIAINIAMEQPDPKQSNPAARAVLASKVTSRSSTHCVQSVHGPRTTHRGQATHTSSCPLPRPATARDIPNAIMMGGSSFTADSESENRVLHAKLFTCMQSCMYHTLL